MKLALWYLYRTVSVVVAMALLLAPLLLLVGVGHFFFPGLGTEFLLAVILIPGIIAYTLLVRLMKRIDPAWMRLDDRILSWVTKGQLCSPPPHSDPEPASPVRNPSLVDEKRPRS